MAPARVQILRIFARLASGGEGTAVAGVFAVLPGSNRSAPPARRIRVAIAEDDDEQRAALQGALEDEGFEVLAFEDGFELVDYFADHPARRRWPDAVITDVGMPGRSGLDAIELARAHGVLAPVFVVTGLPNEQVRAHAARVGVTLLLRKPIEVESLAQAIRALVHVATSDAEVSHDAPHGGG